MNQHRDRAGRPWYLYVLGLLAVGVIVVAVTAIGPPTSSARTSRTVVEAEDGVVQATVSGSGNVEPSTDDTINFGTSGTLDQVFVAVGDRVTQGELLATLDSASQRLSLDQARDELTAAQDNLTSAEAGTSTGSSGSGSSGVETSDDSPSSSTDFVSDVRRISATSTTPESTDFTPTTTTPTTTTPTTTTPTTTTPGGAPTRTVTVTVTTTTPTPSTGTSDHSKHGGSAGTSTSTTSTQGGSTTAKTTTTTTPSPAAIASAQASVDSAEANVKTAEANLAATKLYAPVSGTIATLESVTPGQTVSTSDSSSSDASSSSSTASTGGGLGGESAGSLGGSSSSSSSSSGFATIINSGTLTMTVAFSESDIGSVKVGQPATISIDALSGVELAAHITAISPIGTTSSDVVSYTATLTADQNNSEIRPGMSATATVITGQAQGVTVPNEAITGAGSTGTVNVMKNGKTTSQEVVVGLRGTSRSEIVSGITSGEEVVETITLPALGTTSTTSSSTSSGTLGGSTLGGGAARLFGGGGGGFGGGGGGGFFRGGGG